MTTRKLIYYSIFIALSFVGAQIKIFGSIAFDSMPAFAAALFLGPVAGAVVGFLGHMLTALTSGFPFTVPIHLVIGATMALICYIFGFLKDKVHLGVNAAIATLLNGVGATFVSVFAMKLMGMVPAVMPVAMSLIGVLTAASFANVLIASTMYTMLGNKIMKAEID
ncbi:MAG: ECF transporter S component [Eubacteriaceae bacterium]|nr:ECF transporter S component [Eubacteriaceae bacterium]